MHDLIIIGGGQSALACAYYLRRTDLDYLLLDRQPSCGGAWHQAWDSLHLFSPAEHSSLPGWWMPKSKGGYPTKTEAIEYLCRYEQRYQFPIERPVEVQRVRQEGGAFVLQSSKGEYRSKAVISATGTWGKPYFPELPGRTLFQGEQLHSAHYKSPETFKDKRVLIVGEGNSGAQILADVSKVAATAWATRKPPQFLPDDVDGRVLFDVASAKYYAQQKGETFDAKKFGLGNIVMVPSVIDARERGVLRAKGQLQALYENGVVWANGEREAFDTIIWCTGFGYATDHLQGLVKLDERGRIATEGTRATEVPGLWLVGYGGWTGFASATVIGVGRTARRTAKEVVAYLKQLNFSFI
jgi:cation diffusion facilitator CzcD-associated flavoprotein CzcO